MTVLVTGATGNVGRGVVHRLLEAGVPVRALSRDPARAALPSTVRVFQGDLEQPETVKEALEGVRELFLFPAPETAEQVVELARAAGVKHIVVLSSGAVTAGYDTEFHVVVEQAVERSGLDWTHVRPGEFAMNRLHLWAPSIRERSQVVDPYPDAVDIPTHEGDIADVAADALTRPGHAGAAYTFVGPEALSHREQVAAISEALGRPVGFENCTPEQARDHYRRQGGWAADNADYLLGLTDYSGEGYGDEGGGEEYSGEEYGEQEPAAPEFGTSEQVTGRPARTFAQWARDHREDFR